MTLGRLEERHIDASTDRGKWKWKTDSRRLAWPHYQLRLPVAMVALVSTTSGGASQARERSRTELTRKMQFVLANAIFIDFS